MDADLKKRWVEALRSGKYKQGKGLLRSLDNKYCCLGVLADLQGVDWERRVAEQDYAYPAGAVRPAAGALHIDDAEHWLGCRAVHDGRYGLLAALNDAGRSFNEIADYIEENL